MLSLTTHGDLAKMVDILLLVFSNAILERKCCIFNTTSLDLFSIGPS